MSVRSNIRDNLKTIMQGIDGINTVSETFSTIDEIDSANMPYCQIIPGSDTLAKDTQSKRSRREWVVNIDFYIDNPDNIESWIDAARLAILADREHGGNAVNTALSTIENDEAGLVAPFGFFSLGLLITYDSRDNV